MAGTEHTNFTDRLLGDEQTVARLEALATPAAQVATPEAEQSGQESIPLRERFVFKMSDEHMAYRAAERGDAVVMLSCLQTGFDVNRPRTRDQDTILHIAASRDAKDVVRVLIESGKCDYLIRDAGGRLPSENAYLYGENPALARLLSIKEREQAKAQGIKLTRRP